MNRVAIDLGIVQIYWYAVFITIGIIVAYMVVKKLAKERNIELKHVDNMVFYGIIFGIIGARLYYVIFNLNYYSDNFNEILSIRNGGLAIHGGVIAGFAWIYYYTKKHQINFWDIADLGAIGFLIAQAFGRWGNFVNQEVYGPETTRAALENMNLPEFIIDGMLINGIYYQPTFLYESLWCLLGFLIAFFLRDKMFKYKGDIFCFYLVWYSGMRFYLESIRLDYLLIGNVKVAQLVSVIAIVFAVVIYFYKKKFVGERYESSNYCIEKPK